MVLWDLMGGAPRIPKEPILSDLSGCPNPLRCAGEEQCWVGGREIKWGVAIADKPAGPYTKSEYNPVINSGHEV